MLSSSTTARLVPYIGPTWMSQEVSKWLGSVGFFTPRNTTFIGLNNPLIIDPITSYTNLTMYPVPQKQRAELPTFSRKKTGGNLPTLHGKAPLHTSHARTMHLSSADGGDPIRSRGFSETTTVEKPLKTWS